MANIEMQLISRIVYSGQLAPVLEWGVTLDDFRTVEGKSLFNALCSYYEHPASKLSVMGPNLFQHFFPQVQLVSDSAVATEALCHELRKNRVVAVGKEDFTDFISELEVDPEVAINKMHVAMTKLIGLGVRKNTDVTMSAALDRLITRYRMMKTHGPGIFSKMLWPWDIMNEMTGGIQEDDYVVIYGRPKSMKTWVLARILAKAFEDGKRALIYTKEMTPDNIFQRATACCGRIPYQEYRTGKLEDYQEAMLVDLAAYAKESHFDPICLSGRDANGADTVSWLHSKIEKYKPDIVFIDGMYLLKSLMRKNAATWERVTDISRSIREMVLSTCIPAICTMQANRSAAKHAGGNLDEIAYSDAIGQDATIAMRCIAEKSSPTIALVLAGSREFKLHGFRIHGEPAVNFDFKELMTEKDIKKAEEGDTGEESENAQAHTKDRPKKAVRATDPSQAKSESAFSRHMKDHLTTLNGSNG